MAFLARLGNKWGAVLESALSKVREPYKQACGYRQFGLHHDDLLAENPDMLQALKRLSPEAMQARHRRMKMAFDLSLKGETLPKHLQPTAAEDVNYLRPLIEEVKKERLEREAFRRG